MAVAHGVPRHGPALTGAYVAGLILVFIGQRIVGDSGLTRTLLDGIGVALCAGALVVRFLGRRRALAAASKVETLTSSLYGVGLLALGVYWLTTSSGQEALNLEGSGWAEPVQVIAGGLWLVLMLCSLLALIFIELSYASMPVAGAVELRRVYLSGASGLTLGLALTYLVACNYTANKFEVRRDLSYFKTTAPSESTIRMVKRLEAPVEVILFYPEANEVLERIRPYFDELSRQSKQLKVSVRDHVLAPGLAKQHQVRGNGHVLVTRGDQGKSFNVGLELEGARRRLKELDASFQENFAAVVQPERIFYTTVGHGERTARARDQEENAGINDLTTFVRRFGLRHRTLGLAQGLGSQVPDDAAVVAIIGPDRDFLPEEVASLQRYVRGGGRLLILLEPDTPAGLQPLLEELGLALEPGKLAHEELYRLLTSTRVDRTSITSNRYSSHPSVTTVMRAARGVATVFFNAGHLRETRQEGARVNVILRAVPGTWADLNGNLEFDSETESRSSFALGAAVTLPVAGAEQSEAPGESAGQGEDAEGRAVVIADADVFADRVFRNEGNFWLAADNILWLAGQEEMAGEITSEEDRPIEHTRSQDVVWFWGTVVVVPAFVLVAGLIFGIRRRRRGSQQESS